MAHRLEPHVATDRRVDDPPSPLLAAERPPLDPGPSDPVTTDVRARLLHGCFAGEDEPVETTLPPEDPDAQLAWRPIVFIWRVRRGVQPVIMPRWRRLD